MADKAVERETVLSLRETIARIENRRLPGVVRAAKAADPGGFRQREEDEPGRRALALGVTDLDTLLEGGLPPEVQTHPAAWAGCLSGALSERAMYTALRRAGFRAVSIEPIEPFGIDECALYPLFTAPLLDLLRRLLPADRLDRIATSALLRARKPAAGESLPGRAPSDRATPGTSSHL